MPITRAQAHRRERRTPIWAIREQAKMLKRESPRLRAKREFYRGHKDGRGFGGFFAQVGFEEPEWG
jgi:hypothetical protein